jgi:hypothetical protein
VNLIIVPTNSCLTREESTWTSGTLYILGSRWRDVTAGIRLIMFLSCPASRVCGLPLLRPRCLGEEQATPVRSSKSGSSGRLRVDRIVCLVRAIEALLMDGGDYTLD